MRERLRATAERTVRIESARVTLEADLTVPLHARSVVLFAHGSGSSRFSTRNKRVARILQGSGFGTVLIDLLTRDEEDIDNTTGEFRFDIVRLAERLVGAAEWLSENHPRADFPSPSSGRVSAAVPRSWPRRRSRSC